MPTPAPDLDGLDREARIERMVEWFASNFTDPANELPYNGREGGYQWIDGGPFDASEEIQQAFARYAVEEDEVAEAVEQLEADGTNEWASSRIDEEFDEDERDPRGEPPYGPDDDEEPSIESRLAALAGQLDRIEAYVDYWRGRPQGMGHNRPPAEFVIAPDDDELAQVQQSVDEVRTELAKPDAAVSGDVDTLRRAEGRFSRFAAKIAAWGKIVGKLIGGGIVAGIGKAIGENIYADPVGFYHSLEGAAENIGSWIVHLNWFT